VAEPVEVFEQVPPDDPRAVELYRAHVFTGAEALGRPPLDAKSVSERLLPPGGALLLATMAGEHAAIAGVRDLDGRAAEIVAMFVAPPFRGRGISRRLLARLEAIAVANGCEAARLDTLSTLQAACSLYESAGYERVPDYNGSPHADRWYERRLR
jgi:GNAT superfamily N-acetyltransferase